MIRWAATRLSAGAAAGAAAAATSGSSTETHARARPARYFRPREEGHGQLKPSSEGVLDNEGWTPFNLDGEDVIFGSEEVKEAIDDLSWMTSRPQTGSDDTESIESFGADADTVIANNAVPLATGQGVGMRMLTTLTEKLLSKPSMQSEIYKVLRDDAEIRGLMQEFAEIQGNEIQIIQGPQPQPETSGPLLIEGSPGSLEPDKKRNILEGIVHEIGNGIEATGQFLGKIGRWVKSRVTREKVVPKEGEPEIEEEEVLVGETIAGAVVCFAALVVTVMIAKRMGILAFLRP